MFLAKIIVSIKEWLAKNRPIGLEENIKIAQSGGEVAKNTRLDIEERLKESVITKDNALSYKYIDENNEIESK